MKNIRKKYEVMHDHYCYDERPDCNHDIEIIEEEEYGKEVREKIIRRCRKCGYETSTYIE